jgi:hypothetical protein
MSWCYVNADPPVVNSNQGTLFIKQVEEIGVSFPLGHTALYTFHGPPYTEHIEIFLDLFLALNDKDISEFGLQRSDLQVHVSSQQTIGQFIRTIREEIVRVNKTALNIVRSHNYRPFSVIICFVNPLPRYQTEPIIKAMSMNAFGKIRAGEVLRATQSQRALRWENKRQAFANIVAALDVRLVEIPPEIISKLVYAYTGHPTARLPFKDPIMDVVELGLLQNNIIYNAPKAVRQNLRQQLRASNLFRIIANEETVSHPTPKFSSKHGQQREEKEVAEVTLTKIVCEVSHSRQHELHNMFSQALEDVLRNYSDSIASIADFKRVYPEAGLTISEKSGNQKRVLRPDIVIEMQDKLFLLEFCWRSEEHFTYADIATYVLRKIQESYLNLPLIQRLSE